MKSARFTAIAALILCAVTAFAGGDGEAKTPEMTIHEAAIMSDIKAIKQHVAAGTDIDALDEYGSTPLTIAATFDIPDAARALIDGGADIAIANGEGSTPLHIASFFCRKEIVEMLLDEGASTDAQNLLGLRPIDMVAAPFEQVKPIYDGILQSLGSLGLELDYEHLQKTRPEIHALLARHS